MRLTEEEAKTKTCHVTLSRHAQNGGYGQETNCLGSACMAWQFQPQMWRHASTAGGHWDEAKEINGYGRKGEKLPRLGWCGLAGKQ